jgi:DNA-binding transcriptional regulator YhcF (GntR family)
VGRLKRDAVIRLVRQMIADGTLKPGGAAPSGRALARETGFQPATCRRALGDLVEDGTLTRGVSATGRLRVAQPGGGCHPDVEMLQEKLSRALAARRKAARLTQQQLADVLGVSVTTAGHAETGRTWQSRDFWRHADHLLVADGDLLHLYDTYEVAVRAAPEAAGGDVPAETSAVLPVLPVSVTITPDGVAVAWPDGTQTLVRAPGRQDPETSGAGPTPQPRPGAVPAQEGNAP